MQNSERDLRAEIIYSMMHLNVPSNLYRITKATKLPVGTVDYWLNKLQKEGVVIVDLSKGQRKYLLQPIFYSVGFARTFDKQLRGLYEVVSKKLFLPEGADKELATFATLLSILHVIIRS